ncbi:MAG: hypothetical protein JWN45_2266 [Acidobacteriaceae bacterium]|nr:hypothetical protein [Acidobacteriaceae bacterium]
MGAASAKLFRIVILSAFFLARKDLALSNTPSAARTRTSWHAFNTFVHFVFFVPFVFSGLRLATN